MDLKALVVGTRETIAGTVYGTIIVLSEVTAAASAFKHNLAPLAVIVGVTTIVFWAAHVYSQGIGRSIDLGRQLSATELRRVARRESSMLLAAVLPVLLLALGAAGVLEGRAPRFGWSLSWASPRSPPRACDMHGSSA